MTTQFSPSDLADYREQTFDLLSKNYCNGELVNDKGECCLEGAILIVSGCPPEFLRKHCGGDSTFDGAVSYIAELQDTDEGCLGGICDVDSSVLRAREHTDLKLARALERAMWADIETDARLRNMMARCSVNNAGLDPGDYDPDYEVGGVGSLHEFNDDWGKEVALMIAAGDPDKVDHKDC